MTQFQHGNHVGVEFVEVGDEIRAVVPGQRSGSVASGELVVDFLGPSRLIVTYVGAGVPIDLSATNLAAGREVELLFNNAGSNPPQLELPNDWRDGGLFPMTLSAGQWVVVTLRSTSSADSGVFVTVETTTSGGGGGSGLARDSATITTESLAHEAAELGDFEMPRTSLLLSITLDRAAYVTLYQSEAARDADENRPMDQDPEPGAGVIVDASLDEAGTVILSPNPTAANMEEPAVQTIYYRVVNLSGESAAVEVVVSFLRMEA